MNGRGTAHEEPNPSSSSLLTLSIEHSKKNGLEMSSNLSFSRVTSDLARHGESNNLFSLSLASTNFPIHQFPITISLQKGGGGGVQYQSLWNYPPALYLCPWHVLNARFLK